MGAIWGSLWPALVGLVGLLLGGIGIFVTKKSADAQVAAAEQKRAEAETNVAQAQTQTAEVRDATAQANAVAAQAGAQAIKERNDVESDTAGMSDAAVRDELREWIELPADAGAASGISGGNATR